MIEPGQKNSSTQLKPIKIFVDLGVNAPLTLSEAKYAIRTLADIAGLACHFVTNPKEDSIDLIYSDNQNDIDCQLFIRTAPSIDSINFVSVQSPNNKIIDNDIVLATYLLISGLHEREMTRDKHDHHDIETSILYQNNLLHVPIVNQYGSTIREVFSSHNPLSLWPEGKTWAAAITHDVDYPQMIRWIEMFRYLIDKKGMSKLRVLADIANGQNHFWQFKAWMDLEIRHEVRSAFYFCGRKGSLLEYSMGTPDPFYDVCSKEFKNIISQLKKNGFEVGLHASYNARRSLNGFLKEKKNVEDSLAGTLLGNRHHYWRINPDDPAETSSLHEAAGLLYDTSICYERRAGFRFGIGTPYRLFHKRKKKTSKCLQLPTIFMDTHMITHSMYNRFETPDAEIDSILAETKKFGGLFISNYHVRMLNDTFFPGVRKMFQKSLELIVKDSKCFCKTPTEIAQYWVTREKKLRDASCDVT